MADNKNNQNIKQLQLEFLPKAFQQKNNENTNLANRNTVDIVNLQTKKERVSRMHYRSFQAQKTNYFQNHLKKNISDNAPNTNRRSMSQITQNQKPVANVKTFSHTSQSFLVAYQNRCIVGILIYILFIIFIMAQVYLTAEFIPKNTNHQNYVKQSSLLTVLVAQLVYYVFLRYIEMKTQRLYYPNTSITKSFAKILKKNRRNQSQQNQTYLIRLLSKRPYFSLIIVVVCVVSIQFAYNHVASQSIRIFSNENSQIYMVSSLFWMGFALPFLFNNFYLNRPYQDQNFKVKIFRFIVILFLLIYLWQGSSLFALFVFKVLYRYVQYKQQFQSFSIEYLVKAILVILIIVYSIMDFFVAETGQQYNILSLPQILGRILLIAIGFVITRVFAMSILKQQLQINFYTEMHINIAYVLAAIIIYVFYIFLNVKTWELYAFNIIIDLILIFIVGVIVYLDGNEKIFVSLDFSPQKH